MNELLLAALFVGHLTVTSYQSLTKDTDSSPYYTSTGERTNVHGVAVSRDLLCGACRKLHHRCQRPDNPTKLHYGDLLLIDGVGLRFVNDAMADKHHRGKLIRNQIDVWVPNKKAEKDFFKKFGFNRQKVWVMKGVYEQK